MSKPILNANMTNLTERHGDNAGEVFRELASLGGYGDIGGGQGNIDMNYPGGLGILGALREENTAISDKDKARIAELCGVDRKKDVDNHKGVGLPRTQSEDKGKE